MGDKTDPVGTTPPEFEIWKQYESIAMHFNELIARFRIQAVGGAATIGTVAAAVTMKAESAWTFVGVLAFLAVAWTAIWQLDYLYYQKLLKGCVLALVALEEKMELIKLSTKIEEQFTFRYHGHFWFYSLIQFAVLALLGAATYGPWSDLFAVSFWWVVPPILCCWLAIVVLIAKPAKGARVGSGK